MHDFDAQQGLYAAYRVVLTQRSYVGVGLSALLS